MNNSVFLRQKFLTLTSTDPNYNDCDYLLPRTSLSPVHCLTTSVPQSYSRLSHNWCGTTIIRFLSWRRQQQRRQHVFKNLSWDEASGSYRHWYWTHQNQRPAWKFNKLQISQISFRSCFINNVVVFHLFLCLFLKTKSSVTVWLKQFCSS